MDAIWAEGYWYPERWMSFPGQGYYIVLCSTKYVSWLDTFYIFNFCLFDQK